MTRIASLIFIIIFFACTHRSKKYWRTETEKLEICEKAWVYKNLTQKTEIKVLLFQKQFQFDLSSFPNFIIGVTSDSDTIGIVDTRFEGIIKKNQIVTIIPPEKDILQLISKPCFTVYPNSKDNRLHCAVKTVYYTKIEKVVDK